ncbi:CDK5 and ABL1 enzyme substrate 1-like [Centruroides sculpturatus]|uniref:CDK5 and ABL1 enzyme substrate 1-like n=1 Tax=Centruroides sculpturatus TaxID=218467 RepID=UPI000C6E2024|nr:CDK5 and ABL1 enzyme substrate 1-like [Centruroides sculpturatus]
MVIFSSLSSYTRRNSQNLTKSETKQECIRRRHGSNSRQLSIINDGPDPLDLLALMGFEKPEDGQDVSYSQLLSPSHHCSHHIRCKNHDIEQSGSFHVFNFHFVQDTPILRNFIPPTPSSMATEKSIEWEDNGTCHHPFHVSNNYYHPYLLDDPELVAGKHSTQLAFPSYFCGVDLLTVAQAYVYFEKLILKLLINKQNRKLCAAACLLLSAKLNDVKGAELRLLIEKIEGSFRLNRRDILSSEFGVLVALEFSLHIPIWEIYPHYQHLVYES